ncbi:MAG: ABC transporter permease subunit, partial [Rhodothermaceae bacterium]|nr:ABC transporter permease subunit [Rhodothermaceae bacterium]
PGVGAFIFESITQRDWNVILGFTLLVATLIIVANALIDVLYIFIDPRIRFTERIA